MWVRGRSGVMVQSGECWVEGAGEGCRVGGAGWGVQGVKCSDCKFGVLLAQKL